MTCDVSLCVIRVERSIDDPNNYEDEPQGKLRDNCCNTLQVVRGRREVRNICIETYVLEPPNCSTSVVPKSIFGVEKMEAASASGGSSNGELTKTLNFMSGNPFVETTRGIIHLFKEDELTSIDRAARKSQTVCILAVPSTMTCSDLLTFIAACHSDIKHVRIIKDSSPNQYMALITLRSPRSVEEFYRSFNGIPFNNLEPEWCCHLVFVSRIETVGENEDGSIAPASHTELPICPVCLERMDESVDGILTILCNHAFHGSCLAKWGDTSCPVCRYVQTPEQSAENHCLECMATESLWICLICGHVGCGRYLQGHAYQCHD